MARRLIVAFATDQPGGLDAKVADRLARADTVTLVELVEEDGGWRVANVRVLGNPARELPRGAAPRFLEMLAREGVSVVVGPQPGPHAQEVMRALNLKFYEARGRPVREVLGELLEKLKSGLL